MYQRVHTIVHRKVLMSCMYFVFITHSLQVVLHVPGEEPDIDTAQVVGPGFTHYVSVDTHQVRSSCKLYKLLSLYL